MDTHLLSTPAIIILDSDAKSEEDLGWVIVAVYTAEPPRQPFPMLTQISLCTQDWYTGLPLACSAHVPPLLTSKAKASSPDKCH